MADPQRPDWLDELIGIVRRLCPRPGKEVSDSATRKARRIGRVSPDAELGAGWFWIGLASRKLEDEQLEAAHLAPAEGAQHRKFQLIETLQEGNVLKVRVAEHAPAEGLFLWVPAHVPGQLEQSLLDGLSSISRYALVGQLAAGRADAVRSNLAGGSRPGLNDGQLHAWHACRSPGMHLVWGPPGTGKTKVIAEALQALIAAGNSALLVSSTNIAVDNALARAAATIKPACGVMVRVGTPHLAEIAQNSAVCLDKLVRDRQEALESERCQLEAQIAALRALPPIAELAAAEAELADFDFQAYQAAVKRLKCAQLLAAREAELARSRQREAEAAAATRGAAAGYGTASADHAAAEPARRLITNADGHQHMLDELRLTARHGRRRPDPAGS